MGLSSHLTSFCISHVLICLFAWGENYKSEAKCSESFECGSLGNMSFPFSKSTEPPECGLCVVDCDAKPAPRIKLTSEGFWYDTVGRRNSNTIKINATWRTQLGCFRFVNLSLPNTGSISVTVFPNITLFKCFSMQPGLDDHFGGYKKFNQCEHQRNFSVYYNYTTDGGNRDHTTALVTPPPRGCFIINVPVVPPGPPADPNNLSTLLANEFLLEWHVSDDCYRCHNTGGKCLTGSGDQFYCFEGINSSAPPTSRDDSNWNTHKLGLILGTVSAGVALILIICLVIFIVWHRRRTSSRYILSRSPFSRTEVEAVSAYPGVPVLSYVELEEATNSFDSSKELGGGGFAIVYYGKLRDGREVAVKRLFEHNYKRVQQFMNEIKILTCLRHPNLVSLYGCTSIRSRELLLVYEYVSNGTVADHLHGDRQEERLLSWPIRMNIAIETASALAYLHASDIIHRDVKTNNILLDLCFCVKVADFGLSRLFPNDVTHVSTAPQGTPGYVDPEYSECYQLTNKSDVYSFGVILIELISSLPAVDMSRHRQEINLANLAINKIQRCAYAELIDLSLGYESDPEVKRMTIAIAELAFRCLQVDKELRPTMDEVLEALEDIKEGKEDSEVEKMKNTEEKLCAYESIKKPPSPSSEDTVLLKDIKLPPTPKSVTNVCFSSSKTMSW